MLSGKERAGLLGGAIGLALGAGAVLLGGHLWRLLRGRRLLPFETAPPHPDWKVGDKQPHPFATDKMLALDVAELGGPKCYPLVISAIAPRPIAFVSTLSAAGVGNLAPYSYFGVVSHDPPHVCIGMVRSRDRPSGRKDTLANILATREFTLNMMSEWFVEAANHTCGNFEEAVDEMALVGLTPVASLRVKPPRVAESAVHMECVLVDTHEVRNEASGAVTATIVIGKVLMFHVHEAVATRTPSGAVAVDVEAMRPISRLGGNTYGRTAGTFDLPRPDRHEAPPPSVS
eukprot:jgi/Tetstr1/449602/TSEL_036689.t1